MTKTKRIAFMKFGNIALEGGESGDSSRAPPGVVEPRWELGTRDLQPARDEQKRGNQPGVVLILMRFTYGKVSNRTSVKRHYRLVFRFAVAIPAVLGTYLVR